MHQIATIATLTAFLLASASVHAQEFTSASVHAQEFKWNGTFGSDRDTVMIYEGEPPQTFVVCVTLLLGTDKAVVFGESARDITLTVGACAAIESSNIGVRPEGIYDEFRRSEIGAVMFGTFQQLE